MMTEQVWGEIEKLYIESEEVAHRLGIKFAGNEDVGFEEFEDNWTRLLDVTPVIVQLEAREASARAIMEKFIFKVDSGMARSKETYAEMKEWLDD